MYILSKVLNYLKSIKADHLDWYILSNHGNLVYVVRLEPGSYSIVGKLITQKEASKLESIPEDKIR